jgi:hypothetical protein
MAHERGPKREVYEAAGLRVLETRTSSSGVINLGFAR